MQTLLKFCQVPENRIKLMEYLIKDLNNQDYDKCKYYICHIVNSPQFVHIFKRDNNINVSIEEKCTGKSIGNPFINYNYEIRLDQLLPELLKYRHYRDNSIDVWFYESADKADAIEIRIEALSKAINDIKNSLNGGK